MLSPSNKCLPFVKPSQFSYHTAQEYCTLLNRARKHQPTPLQSSNYTQLHLSPTLQSAASPPKERSISNKSLGKHSSNQYQSLARVKSIRFMRQKIFERKGSIKSSEVSDHSTPKTSSKKISSHLFQRFPLANSSKIRTSNRKITSPSRLEYPLIEEFLTENKNLKNEIKNIQKDITFVENEVELQRKNFEIEKQLYLQEIERLERQISFHKGDEENVVFQENEELCLNTIEWQREQVTDL